MAALSVFMPVRNGARWLDAAIGSVVAQTFRDWELVVLDDASTDGTPKILDRWSDHDDRIRVVTSEKHLGLAEGSNQAVRATRALLVARMDADDISPPQRFEKQVEVFGSEPDTVLVGTLAEGIDSSGRKIRPRDRSRLLRPGPFAPFPHGSVMFKRSAFDSIGGYRCESEGCEDLELFLRLADIGRVFVIPDALYLYRYHVANTAIDFPDPVRIETLRIRDGYIGEILRTRSPGTERNGQLKRAGEMLMSQSAMSVWAGNRPMTRARLTPRALFGSREHLLRNLLYSTWGNIHPVSLRGVLSYLIRARDMAVSPGIELGGPREWRFGS